MTREVAGSTPAERSHAGVAQLVEHPGPRAQGGRRFDSSPLHHYLVVRADIPLGAAMAQLAHAAGHTGGPAAVDAHVVVLATPDEDSLLELARKLELAGMEPTTIREPDPPWCGAAMALALEPRVRDRQLRRLVGKLPLYAKAHDARS